MSAPNSGASIVMKPKNFFNNWDIFWAVDYNLTTDDYVNRLAEKVKQIMKDNAPQRTGQLKSSIQRTEHFTALGGIDKRYNISVGPTAPYAQYPESGAGQSPGRFVPALRARLVNGPNIGVHPGQKPQWYVKRTLDLMNSQLPASLQTDLAPKLRLAWERRLNS